MQELYNLTHQHVCCVSFSTNNPQLTTQVHHMNVASLPLLIILSTWLMWDIAVTQLKSWMSTEFAPVIWWKRAHSRADEEVEHEYKERKCFSGGYLLSHCWYLCWQWFQSNLFPPKLQDVEDRFCRRLSTGFLPRRHFGQEKLNKNEHIMCGFIHALKHTTKSASMSNSIYEEENFMKQTTD